MDADVCILDCGGQYTHLLDRVVGRDLGYDTTVTPIDDADPARYEAAIISGGPDSVTDPDHRGADLALDELPPTLGLCYGHQLLVDRLGGTVGTREQYGAGTTVRVTAAEGPFRDYAVGDEIETLMSHGDAAIALPDGAVATAVSDDPAYEEPVNAGFASADRRYWGLQFHPETSHTPDGDAMLAAFLEPATG